MPEDKVESFGKQVPMQRAAQPDEIAPSYVFFAANDALTEETPFAPEALDGGQEKFNLYEWHEGELSLVNVMPGNATTYC